MRWLLFLSRLAFICGVFFVLSLSLLFWDWAKDGAVVSTIIIIGTVLGALTVPLVNICYLVVAVWKRNLLSIVPLWLVAANVFYLVLFGFYIYYQNEQSYYPA